MMKKIWKDPVGSKIIAWIIIGIITLIGIKIKSYYDEKSFTETVNWLISYQIKLIHVVLVLVVFLLLRWLYKRVFARKDSDYSKRQLQLMAFDHMTNFNLGIRSEWTVYFGGNEKPFIMDLDFFCIEHGDVPLRFFENKCSINGCRNSEREVSVYKMKNHIESLVIDKWNKIK